MPARQNEMQKPARIPPQTPPPRGQNAKNKLVSVLRKSISPENSFRKTESELKPRHTARILGGQNPKKKNVLSILEKIHPRENQKSKEHFFFLGLPSEARRWRGFRGAYDLVSSHHALRACHIICFGNRCEFGTIQTPVVTCDRLDLSRTADSAESPTGSKLQKNPEKNTRLADAWAKRVGSNHILILGEEKFLIIKSTRLKTLKQRKCWFFCSVLTCRLYLIS